MNVRRSKYLTNAESSKARSYWIDKLSGDIVLGSIPVDINRNETYHYVKGAMSFSIPDNVCKKAMKLTSGSDELFFILLTAAINVLIYKYTGTRDMLIGTFAFKGNGQNKIFNKVVPLRSSWPEKISFKKLLVQVRSTINEASRYSHYPLSKLKGILNEVTGESYGEYCDTMIHMENIHNTRVKAKLTPKLLFGFKKNNTSIECTVEYNKALYERSSINRLVKHFNVLLHQVSSNVDIKLSDIELISQKEKRLLLDWGNNPSGSAFKNKTVISLFEEQVNKCPSKVAVVFEHLHLTYSELNNRVNQLAYYMQNKYNIKKGDSMAILMDRSEWPVISFLAILKLGVVYMPIDSSYPENRIAYMMKDSNVQFCICSDKFCSLVKGMGVEYLNIDESENELVNCKSDNVIEQISLKDPAYIIYTSGSTGSPIGILHAHRCLSNLIQWELHESGIQGGLRNLQYTALAFDVSLQEMLFSLISTGTLYLLSDEIRGDMRRLETFLIRNKLEVVFMTCSALSTLINFSDKIIEKASLKHIMTGGERLRLSGPLKKLLNKNSDITLYNFYGPSESHVMTSYPMNRKLGNLLPYPFIGKPISSIQVYILDENIATVPVGVCGEIYIGGAQLAMGYLNRSELTEQRFISNPFNPGEFLYKTGDIGRWSQEGNIEFIGRRDEQIKIHGNRVELREIESMIKKYPDIIDTAILVRETTEGNNELVAYIVGKSVKIDKLKVFLRGRLPSYMIPSYFVPIKRLPLNPNGKIDKKSLPIPENTLVHPVTEYVAPRNEIETKLTAIWQEILGKKRIGVHDDFFKIGGNSLNAISVITKAYKEFDIELSPNRVFVTSTIAGLSSEIEAINWVSNNEPSGSFEEGEVDEVTI